MFAKFVMRVPLVTVGFTLTTKVKTSVPLITVPAGLLATDTSPTFQTNAEEDSGVMPWLAVTKVVFTGIISLSITPVAFMSPVLETEMV